MIALLAQPGPPNTASFYHIAYTWVAVLYGGYAAYLWRRAARVRARLDALHRGARTRPA
jgi:hypothetical protein